MGSPGQSLPHDDRNLVLRFVCFFSRFEFALKASGFLKGDERGAEADWDMLSNSLTGTLISADGQSLQAAVNALLAKPPKKQVVREGRLAWTEPALGSGESNEAYVLRLVRQVRNNLFHGGKYPYPDGPLQGTERNKELLRAGLEVLGACLRVSPELGRAFAGDPETEVPRPEAT